MRRRMLVTTVVLLVGLAGAVTPRARQRPFEDTGAPAPVNGIDDLVFARLKRLGVQPAPLASDAVFLRRAYVDVIGTLPTLEEARTFLASHDPRKRAALVDTLLDRNEFADYWTMKWSDLLRVKSEFPINLWPNAVQAYHHWIRTSVRDNVPYDRFARALLTGSGSSLRVPQVNFYRAVQNRDPQGLAQVVALTFMGVRAERWPAAERSDLASFFSQVGYKYTGEWKEEIVFPTDAAARVATLPDGTRVEIPAGADPRDVFAAWLTTPANPWFTRNIANRVWSWLMGRGIIDEADDIRPDNPPADPALLAWLERDLVASHDDLKHLFRQILNSATYQLSSLSDADRPDDPSTFSHYSLRPLDAEVLIDALCQITGTTEEYSSAIPEPFTFMPAGQRAIALADGSVTSAFLETFGRPPRDTGLESERSSKPTAAERLHLLNSSHIQGKVDQSAKLLAIIQARGDIREVVTNLYLSILSRVPTDDELQIAAAHAQKAGTRRAAGLDLAWALINSVEFLYRH